MTSIKKTLIKNIKLLEFDWSKKSKGKSCFLFCTSIFWYFCNTCPNLKHFIYRPLSLPSSPLFLHYYMRCTRESNPLWEMNMKWTRLKPVMNHLWPLYVQDGCSLSCLSPSVGSGEPCKKSLYLLFPYKGGEWDWGRKVRQTMRGRERGSRLSRR